MLDFETEIPSIVQRCQGSPDLYEGLSLRFANYDRLQGKVERIAKRYIIFIELCLELTQRSRSLKILNKIFKYLWPN